MAKNNRKKKKQANKANQAGQAKKNNRVKSANTTSRANTTNQAGQNSGVNADSQANKTNQSNQTKQDNQANKPNQSKKTNQANKNSKSKKTEVASSRPKTMEYYWPFIPIILVLGYLPILMRTISFDTHFEDYDWAYAGNATQVDVFLKVKAIFFIIITVLMLFIMLIWYFNGNRKYFARLKSLPFYLIGGALVFVIISGIFAENKSLLLAGSFENFESIFVTIGYFVAFVYAFVVFTRSDNIYRDFRFVYRASIPGFLIVAVIGFFQTLGLDVFKTDFGKFLFVSSEYRQANAEISVGSGEYTTLHNIDYVSTFFAMWTFIFLILLTMSGDIKDKIVRAALCLLAVYDMFMAKSDGGRLGFVAAAILLVILVASGNKKRLAIVIGAIVVVIATVLIVPQTRNYIVQGIGATDKDTASSYFIHHITPKDDGVYFDMDGKEYSVSYYYEGPSTNSKLNVKLKDANGNPIEGTYVAASGDNPQRYDYPASATPKGTKILATAYQPVGSEEVIRGIQIEAGSTKKSFMVSDEVDDSGDYYFLNVYGNFVKDDGTDIANANVFPAGLFSSRGTIWNKTLPILKNYLFIGCGSGLFITAFPQNNYIDRLNGSTNYDVKPHDLYLQYWVEQGLPFLLIMLAFFVLYYITTIRSFVKREEGSADTNTRRISLACMLAVTVFLVAGIPGDSMIVHSPTFWTFLGIGLAAGWSTSKKKA